ncbi:hypothetical protein GUITHDRAFT_116419 [Guillardia theta CCMP2712]|uniref:Methyltransferase domain-containing protein n=1 Tax=Guillardia theta (strain CCMP2712) TaxID=905079 RepID=L1INR3_GUITC|nr:hypothetical protein GUITHDRAFT_116419 [Guillardia theta CCMP2712]EKX37455.1 hypothetical protein GUITHDRAFT_116419 [Guillardia theta CCMP2712]|eukprot:XP_005824435.1 hypothetical protein GUITHDRAFT_116419 [Guillardia theta CCMP2712]
MTSIMESLAEFSSSWFTYSIADLEEQSKDKKKEERGRFTGKVCWSWLKRRDETCCCSEAGKGELKHVGNLRDGFPCAQHINSLFGNGKDCTPGAGRCSGAHWSEERFSLPWGCDGILIVAESSSLSIETSREEASQQEVDCERLLRILVEEKETLMNAHLEVFLRSPWVERFRQDTRLASLLKFKNRSKEITEAMAAGDQVVMLDVCSGKGFTGLLLSLEFPRASVYLLDANGNMNMSHCSSQDNLSFLHFDLFSSRAAEVLVDIAGMKTVIAVGMHLCGSLSPRLIDLFAFLPAAKALVLCPCCLRGYLGKTVKAAAKESGRGYDETLCEVLADMLR